MVIFSGRGRLHRTRPIALLFVSAAILAYLTPLIQWAIRTLHPSEAKTA